MKQIPSPNFFKRHDKRIAVVLHVSAGTLASMDSWFSTPLSQVSAHYGIGKNGEVHQYVDEKNSSWAVGVVIRPTWKLLRKGINPNYYTISIEHEGYGTTVWTEKMKSASEKLIRGICERHDIPITRENIIGHYEIDDQKPHIKRKVDNMVARLRRTTSPSNPSKKAELNLLVKLLMQLANLLKRLLNKRG